MIKITAAALAGLFTVGLLSAPAAFAEDSSGSTAKGGSSSANSGSSSEKSDKSTQENAESANKDKQK